MAGTSDDRDDKKYFSFTPTADGTLSVVLNPDGDGRFADLDVTNTATDEDVLELEPSDDEDDDDDEGEGEGDGNSGEVDVLAGVTYLIRLRSPDLDPVGFLVDLELV